MSQTKTKSVRASSVLVLSVSSMHGLSHADIVTSFACSERMVISDMLDNIVVEILRCLLDLVV